MIKTRVTQMAAVGVMAVATAAGLALAQQAQPGNQPAPAQQNQPAQPQGKISPEAKAELDQVRQAYSNLKSLAVEGTITADIDAGEGRQQKTEQKFTGRFMAPNFFRHELGDQLMVGAGPENTFAYSKRDNSYLLSDPLKAESPATAIPRPIPDILQSQNPSLFFALEEEPLKSMGPGLQVDKLADAQIEGKNHTVLRMTAGENAPVMKLFIDPQTHLIRRISSDSTAAAQRQNPAVKKAEFSIDYTKVDPNAAVAREQFAWSPPEGAQDIRALQEERQKQNPAMALVGQQAPDFQLKTLDGQAVSLKDLKGKVVLLDFWATWCPPCVESLPHLAKFGQQVRQQNRPVNVYAVNLREDQQRVGEFLKQHKLDVPVLMDQDGNVAQGYRVQAIPQTVLIGADGKVKRVWVGAGPNLMAEIEKEVDALVKEAGGVSAR